MVIRGFAGSAAAADVGFIKYQAQQYGMRAYVEEEIQGVSPQGACPRGLCDIEYGAVFDSGAPQVYWCVWG